MMEHPVMINRNEIPSLVTVGVFEPTKPWLHVDRTLNIDTLLYVVSGAVHVCEENVDYTVTSNQVFFLKNRCHHWGKKSIAPGTRWYWVSFVPSELSEENEPLVLPKQLTVSSPEHVTYLLSSMLRLFHTSEPLRSERLNGYLYQLLYELLHQHLQAGSEHHPTSVSSQIIRCLTQQVEQPFDSEAIAEALSMNYTYLGRLFKSATGLTINQYYRRLKVQRAIELMQDATLNIAQISERLQFPNPYYFSRVFKQVTGFSPREYREQGYR
ncbi:helix-turn-helix transcriptional regulator [Paenibacillus sp. YYML68]|uniref:helix-turn-helix transcriptional regulator n=1 Tax=Paenibacillus sp. YYML68 TaxID=2909250 RepID=UPI0024931CAF|nr:helix-turn-helix transcriptional regulator [Paenibacillus sp. YYML68]